MFFLFTLKHKKIIINKVIYIYCIIKSLEKVSAICFWIGFLLSIEFCFGTEAQRKCRSCCRAETGVKCRNDTLQMENILTKGEGKEGKEGE